MDFAHFNFFLNQTVLLFVEFFFTIVCTFYPMFMQLIRNRQKTELY